VSTEARATPIEDPGSAVPASVAAVVASEAVGNAAGVESSDVDPLLHAARVSTPAVHRAATVIARVGSVEVSRTVGRVMVNSW
jgi:hypothetical protein